MRKHIEAMQKRLAGKILGHGLKNPSEIKAVLKEGLRGPYSYACVGDGWEYGNSGEIAQVRFKADNRADRTYPDPENFDFPKHHGSKIPFSMASLAEEMGSDRVLDAIEAFLDQNEDEYEDPEDPGNYNLVIIGEVPATEFVAWESNSTGPAVEFIRSAKTMNFVSKKALQTVAEQNPEMIWYCGPIREGADFTPPPGTIAVCFQMLEEPVPGEQVLEQCGSYFAVAPRMSAERTVAWLRSNETEHDHNPEEGWLSQGNFDRTTSAQPGHPIGLLTADLGEEKDPAGCMTETEIRARLTRLNKLFAEADGPNSEVLATQITELEIVLGDRSQDFSA